MATGYCHYSRFDFCFCCIGNSIHFADNEIPDRKNSVKYTGRQIKVSWLYLNPFSGYIYLSNVRIYEAKSDSLFLTATGITAHFMVYKLFANDYEITGITIDKPWINVILNEKYHVNFDDLITRFNPPVDSSNKSAPLHINFLDIKINDGEYHYLQPSNHISYFIKKVNMMSTGFRWDNDTIKTTYEFSSGPSSGNMKGKISINMKTLDYSLETKVTKYDLHFFEQYVKDMANYGSFKANLDADLKASGNFGNILNLKATGLLAINKLHFGKKAGDDFISFDKFSASIIELNPGSKKFIFDSIILKHPFAVYEQYDYLDNMQRMFGKNGEGVVDANNSPAQFNLIIEIANYVKVLVSQFYSSYYKANRIAIYDADFKYSDFSLAEKFSIEASPLNVIANTIDKDNNRVSISLVSGVRPYGNILLNLSVNPKDVSDFDQVYSFSNFPLSMFNPYLISYTSFSMNRGTIEVSGKWNVKQGILQSANHVLIIDPRIDKKNKSKDAKWLPVPLFMAFVKPRSNVIDYDIPVNGNLKSPKFQLRDIIVNIVNNILTKPPTFPYVQHEQKQEKKIESALTLEWQMRQFELAPKQERFLKKINSFLVKQPGTAIDVYPLQYTEKEKEHILLFEAKKKFLLLSRAVKDTSFDEGDSLQVENMSVKDSMFVRFLNRWRGDSLAYTIQEKCVNFVGANAVNLKFYLLLKARQASFLSGFDAEVARTKIKMHYEETTIPFSGYSCYNIVYKGGFPQELSEAYDEMDKLNNEPPRQKYKAKRESAFKAAKPLNGPNH